MRVARTILLLSVPGLMFFIIPIEGISFRLCWQLGAIWLAGIAFMAFLTSWFRRIFFLLALLQVVLLENVILVSYITLMMIAIFLAAIEGFKRICPEHVFNSICIAGLLLAGWIVLQRAGLLGVFTLGAFGAGPFNIDTASAFLGMTLPAFFRGRVFKSPPAPLCKGGEMVYWWHLLPLIVAGLFLARASTGVIAALAGAAVWTFFADGLRKKRVLGAVAVGGLLLVIFFNHVDTAADLAANPRWRVWQRTIMTYESAPWGRGLGSYAQIFPLFIATETALQNTVTVKTIKNDGIGVAVENAWLHAHNEYLQTGFEMGLPAMGLLFAFLIFIYGRAWLRRESLTALDRMALSGLAATAVAAAGFHIFHIAPTALLGCAWLGMIDRYQGPEVGDQEKEKLSCST